MEKHELSERVQFIYIYVTNLQPEVISDTTTLKCPWSLWLRGKEDSGEDEVSIVEVSYPVEEGNCVLILLDFNLEK